MCDSDNNNSFTIRHALKALDEGKGQVGYEYFEARHWLDLTKRDINNQKWTAPGVYNRLFKLTGRVCFGFTQTKGDQVALTN